MKKNQTNFLKLCLADSLLKLMTTQEFETINVNAICSQADVGRTTFYRYFGNKNSKEDLLIFKVGYEWECYSKKNEEGVKRDKMVALTNFVYEQKDLLRLLHQNGLITTIMRIFENLVSSDTAYDKQTSYLASFFIYGFFGIIYQWIKYDFDETTEQIQKHIQDAGRQGEQ